MSRSAASSRSRESDTVEQQRLVHPPHQIVQRLLHPDQIDRLAPGRPLMRGRRARHDGAILVHALEVGNLPEAFSRLSAEAPSSRGSAPPSVSSMVRTPSLPP